MFWKVYFRLFSAVLVIAIAATAAGLRKSDTTGVDLIEYAFDAMSLVGLYGYAWNRQVINRNFWKIFVPVYVIWTLYVMTASPSRMAEANLPEAILATLIVLPLYFALVRYAYWPPDVTARGATAQSETT